MHNWFTGDLSSDDGLSQLNNYLKERSYFEGYTPSQADVTVFKMLPKSPDVKYSHLLRWYNHIKSYSNEFSDLPGVIKSLEELGFGGDGSKKKTTVDNDEEDDFDLFGSDDEADVEAEKIKEERLKVKYKYFAY